MRKLASAVLAVAMTLAMTVTAFAAPSPTADVTPVSGKVTLADGTTVNVTSENIGDYVTVSDTDETTTVDGYSTAATAYVELASGVESMTVTLSVPGVKAGQTVIVKQLVNGEWIKVEATAIADGEVQVTLANSGAIAICVKNENTNTQSGGTQNGGNTGTVSSGTGTTSSTTGSTTSTTGTSSTTSSTTSPKTGEANVAAILVLAAAFAGVAAVAGKKANA